MIRTIIKVKLIKYIICSALIILTALHILKGFFSGFEFNQLSIIVFAFYFVALYKNKKELVSIAFLLQAIMTILTMTEMSNLTPSLILFIAMLFCSKIRILAAMSIIIPVAFIGSHYMNGFGTISQIVEGIVINYFILTFLYFAVINKPTHIAHLARITPLDARQLIILKYLSRDISRKEMPDKVPERELWKHDIDNFTFDIINSEVSKIKKILDLKSEFALGIWYSEKCEISRNTSKS